MNQIFETERLWLRPFHMDDFEQFFRMASDSEVMLYLGNGKPISRYEAWQQMSAIVGHWHLRGFGIWAAEEKETGKFVGRIGLQRPEGWPDVEAVWILSREHWGKGYAVEGARYALKYAAARLGLKRVISLIHPDNAGSIRVAEKVGEQYEGPLQIIGVERLIYAKNFADPT